MSIKVVQIVDSLNMGGIERMSVNMANPFPDYGIESYLLVTRKIGGLETFVNGNVKIKIFNKKSFFDIFSFFKILSHLKVVKPDILHAHQSSIFWAFLLKYFLPRTKLIWHDHFGQSEMLGTYPRKEMNWMMPSIDAVITVNDLIP